MIIKVKPDEGQEFKAFDLELKKETKGWKTRCEITDRMMAQSYTGELPLLSWYGETVLSYTTLKEEDLDNYSLDEIAAMSNAIFNEVNRKKK